MRSVEAKTEIIAKSRDLNLYAPIPILTSAVRQYQENFSFAIFSFLQHIVTAFNITLALALIAIY